MKYLLMICILLSASLALAQGWHWQNTLIQGTSLSCITFTPDGQYGWTTSGTGDVLSSTDRGQTWTLRAAATGYDLNKVAFADSVHGCAVGWYDNGILYTSDGGRTWDLQYEDTLGNLSDVSFADRNSGWAVGMHSGQSDYGVILHSTDGGVSWTVHDSSSTDPLQAISFVSPQVGWVIGYNSVKSTTDGGQSWTTVPSNCHLVDKTKFLASGEGWALGLDRWGHGSRLLGTTNGGLDWMPQICGTDTLDRTLGFDFSDDNNGWAVGFWGGIYHTTNAGALWSRQDGGTGASFSSVKCASSSEAWAVGQGGLLLHTTDSGVNWNAQAGNPLTANYGFEAVEFCDTLNGWAAGDSGAVLRTTDGGGAWTPVTTGRLINFLSIAVITPEHVWLAGASDTVLSTTDAGAHWTSHILGHSGPYEPLPHHTAHVGPDHIWVLADSAYRSTDDGQTWTGHWWLVQNAFEYPLGMQFADEDHGWIRSEGDEGGGSIIHTSDGGDTWAVQYISDWACRALTFINADIGWASANNDSLIHTTDGGATWSGIEIPQIGFAGVIQFTDALNGWIMYGPGMGWPVTSFLHSTDGGLSWEVVTSPCGNFLNSFYFADASHGSAVGNSGTILHYDGISSAAKPSMPPIPRQYSLSAYPNPFNPTTILSFDVPRISRVTLRIYDITGRLVETLTDRVYPQGNFRVDFDGSRLSSGIFFARLQGQSFSKTQKLVLLK